MADVGGVQLRFPNLGRFDVPTVDVDILGRVQDMYSGKKGSTPKDSGGTNATERALGGAYASSALGMIPGIGPALQQAIGGASMLQANPGMRTARIKELAGDVNKRGTYDSSTNTYSGLNIIDRVMDIRPDAVTSQIAANRKKDLENSAAVKAIKLEKGENDFNKIFPKGAATNNLEIESLASKIDTRKGLLKSIDDNQGAELLASEREKAGGKLTNEQLKIVRDKAKKSTPTELRAQAKSDSEVALRTAQGEAATTEAEAAVTNAEANQTSAGASVRNADANMMTANTGRIQAINADRLAQAELDFKNSQLKHNYDIAEFEARERAREANLDRNLRKDLAILGLEDKRDERKFDRESDERRERTMMIMQLLNGLKNSASNFVF